MYEGALGEFNELDRKRQRLEVEGNKQLAAKQEQQLQKKKNVCKYKFFSSLSNLV